MTIVHHHHQKDIFTFIKNLFKDVTNFFDKTDRLNTQLEEMSDTLKNPGNGFISIVTGRVADGVNFCNFDLVK